MKFSIGTVKFRVMERGKPEYGPGDYSFLGFALLAKEGIFAEVIESGYLVEGDTITVCMPVMALDGKSVDAMVVGGIGAGALVKLNALGIKVYGAKAPTIQENLALLSENGLQELSVDNSCRAHQGGCGH